MEWKPIESAPDEEDVLLCLPRYGVPEDREPFREMAVGRLSYDGCWYSDGDDKPEYKLHNPTHWMPLPPPPLSD
jgi:Protein of unknown function (DUF551)